VVFEKSVRFEKVYTERCAGIEQAFDQCRFTGLPGAEKKEGMLADRERQQSMEVGRLHITYQVNKTW
jgi:hypothetical protein